MRYTVITTCVTNANYTVLSIYNTLIPVAYYTKKINPNLAKPPLELNCCIIKLVATSLAKLAIGDSYALSIQLNYLYQCWFIVDWNQ